MIDASSLMWGQEYEVTSTKILELANISTCSVFQCEFVALAQDLNVSLVAVDQQILRHFPDTALSVDAFIGSK
jgi:hypothetical protein